MRKKIYLIILTIFIFSHCSNNDKLNATNSLFDKKVYQDIEVPGEGFIIALKTNDKNIGTVKYSSFWIKKGEFTSYLFLKSFFKKTQKIHIKVLLNYQGKSFKLNQQKNFSKNYVKEIKPGSENVFHIKLAQIPKGAHDLTILVLTEKNNFINDVYPIRKNIFYKSHSFPNISSKFLNLKIVNKYTKKDKVISMENFKNTNVIAMIQFENNKHKKFLKNNFVNYFQISKKIKKTQYLDFNIQRKIKKSNNYILLISNPFLPIEYPPGKINKYINNSILLVR